MLEEYILLGMLLNSCFLFVFFLSYGMENYQLPAYLLSELYFVHFMDVPFIPLSKEKHRLSFLKSFFERMSNCEPILFPVSVFWVFFSSTLSSLREQSKYNRIPARHISVTSSLLLPYFSTPSVLFLKILAAASVDAN